MCVKIVKVYYPSQLYMSCLVNARRRQVGWTQRHPGGPPLVFPQSEARPGSPPDGASSPRAPQNVPDSPGKGRDADDTAVP